MSWLNNLFGWLSDFGNLLASPKIGPFVIVLMIILGFVAFRLIRKIFNTKETKKDEPDTTTTDPKKTKKKRNISFAWLGKPIPWLRKLKKDDFFYWIMWPGGNLLLIVLWYLEYIHLSGGEWFWLVVLNLAIIIFATRSRLFRNTVMWTGSIAIIIAIIWYTIVSWNLLGTPWPYEQNEANLWFEHDVSKPRWTATSIIIPDDCMLEISTSGTYYWDTLDSRGPCGPNGMRDTETGLWIPTKRIQRPEQFLPELLEHTFAGFIGQVGDNDAFFIGTHRLVYVEKGGMLYTGINIRWWRTGGMRGYTGPDSWKKNWSQAKGTVDVDVTIIPRSEWEKKQT